MLKARHRLERDIRLIQQNLAQDLQHKRYYEIKLTILPEIFSVESKSNPSESIVIQTDEDGKKKKYAYFKPALVEVVNY